MSYRTQLVCAGRAFTRRGTPGLARAGVWGMCRFRQRYGRTGRAAGAGGLPGERSWPQAPAGLGIASGRTRRHARPENGLNAGRARSDPAGLRHSCPASQMASIAGPAGRSGPVRSNAAGPTVRERASQTASHRRRARVTDGLNRRPGFRSAAWHPTTSHRQHPTPTAWITHPSQNPARPALEATQPGRPLRPSVTAGTAALHSPTPAPPRTPARPAPEAKSSPAGA